MTKEYSFSPLSFCFEFVMACIYVGLCIYSIVLAIDLYIHPPTETHTAQGLLLLLPLLIGYFAFACVWELIESWRLDRHTTIRFDYELRQMEYIRGDKELVIPFDLILDRIKVSRVRGWTYELIALKGGYEIPISNLIGGSVIYDAFDDDPQLSEVHYSRQINISPVNFSEEIEALYRKYPPKITTL